MKGLLNSFIFAAGVAIGSAVTWKLVKTKYEQIAREEIEDVKERFGQRLKELNKEEPITESETEPSFQECFEILKSNGYTEEGAKMPVSKDDPYVISPDEFGEDEEYETISLTYYSDGILADDADEIIEDIDSMIGVDSLTHFGEYEDDSVFVRNDRLRCDYEILRDTRDYADVHPDTSPHQVGE